MQSDVTGDDGSPSGGRLEILGVDGVLRAGAEPAMDPKQMLEALRLMKFAREVDRRAVSLQRQGRFGTLSTVTGQEASVVGSALALERGRDWLVPQYREQPALIHHGFPLEHFFLYFMGNLAGASVPEGVKVLPIQIALAAQLPHAVGLAWGLGLQGKDEVVIVYFGDGASSEGDFHEACNLAGVVKAPVIFFLQNNGWAISTPREIQTAAASFADRAAGYGIAGAVVDGNDLLAVHAVTREAVERARAGDGPTLIESQTYRLGPHNTADDPTRYVDEAELDQWRARDPIVRVQRYLEARGLWDADREAEVQAEIAGEIDRALAAAHAVGPPGPEQLFEHVYADMPPRLAAQLAELRGNASGGL